ncbi:hypothetical protein MJO29_006046 [Puccinia striiformis f. sp. tritici]|uniref:Uncharacterized protein n=2 Tax=Puccinia striiformis TaxID=27350 RepID=A0A0L0V207_9BASI|nr:hypothetical protein Pst134EA_011260 [Puccinia striiformis f. sp. tritici]KAI9604870.1 hypothetical protein H4Q26_002840 [Puccinia striiformis f. sp. tritici PST-130]KNE93323.1 hypothetical protein PSTG_13265 [Puccinia striiformis f. sp. tritici PST-78]POW21440.1 hypothetical protein PSHT_02355 [Puccinia striiformis]KAH9456015.1 hypothetical protein Pst134EB_012236 [Puccinia striiformis f. sp. tritici]KAH9467622.1 hypothetical protein Pst134EA_011260 [Puccinia striiformis f. sp. tritici]
MWEQDDWNSCEDLTLCQTRSSAWNLSLEGDAAQRHPYRYSSYPVGCTPEKILKQNQESEKRKSGVKESPKPPLVECIKHKRRTWMKAVARFFGSVRRTRRRDATSQRNSAKELKRGGQHDSMDGPDSSNQPLQAVHVTQEGKAPPSTNQVQLWSFTQSIRKRLSRPAPSGSDGEVPRKEAEGQSTKPSSLLSISTKSSNSLPFNRPEESDDPNSRATHDSTSHFSIPRIDTLFEPFAFEPSELMEELR